MRMPCMGHPSGNTLNNFEKKVTTHSKSKTGNTFFGLEKTVTPHSKPKPGNTFLSLEKMVTAQSKPKTGNTFFGLEKMVTAAKESPLRGELNAAFRCRAYGNRVSRLPATCSLLHRIGRR